MEQRLSAWTQWVLNPSTSTSLKRRLLARVRAHEREGGKEREGGRGRGKEGGRLFQVERCWRGVGGRLAGKEGRKGNESLHPIPVPSTAGVGKYMLVNLRP